MAIKKYRLQRLVEGAETPDIVHLETSSDLVVHGNGTVADAVNEAKRRFVNTRVVGNKYSDPSICDYICDGTDDQMEINAAIANGNPFIMSEGKQYPDVTVIILPGDYHLSGPIEYKPEFKINANVIIRGLSGPAWAYDYKRPILHFDFAISAPMPKETQYHRNGTGGTTEMTIPDNPDTTRSDVCYTLKVDNTLIENSYCIRVDTNLILDNLAITSTTTGSYYGGCVVYIPSSMTLCMDNCHISTNNGRCCIYFDRLTTAGNNGEVGERRIRRCDLDSSGDIVLADGTNIGHPYSIMIYGIVEDTDTITADITDRNMHSVLVNRFRGLPIRIEQCIASICAWGNTVVPVYLTSSMITTLSLYDSGRFYMFGCANSTLRLIRSGWNTIIGNNLYDVILYTSRFNDISHNHFHGKDDSSSTKITLDASSRKNIFAYNTACYIKSQIADPSGKNTVIGTVYSDEFDT